MINNIEENGLLCSCKVVLKKGVFKPLSLNLNSNSTFKAFKVSVFEST